MNHSRFPDDVTDVLARVGRLAWVTTSFFAIVAAVIALVAIAVVLIFSIL